MKVKLLRIVRKKYRIFRYPNGLMWSWFTTTTPTLVLMNGSGLVTYNEEIRSPAHGNGFYVKGKLKPEQEAFQALKDRMLLEILTEYSDKGVRRIKHQQIRKHIYYNENNNPK